MTQLASDNFTRANENPLSDGGKWTTVSGSIALQLVSDLCEASATSGAGTGASMFWNPISWPADQYTAVTVTAIANANGNGDDCCGLVRINGTSFYVGGVANKSAGTTGLGNSCFLFIGYFNGTNEVELSQAILVANVGDVFKLIVHQNTFLLLQNGVVVLIGADNNVITGSAGAHIKIDSTLTNSQMSAWSAGTPTLNLANFSDTFTRANGPLGSNWLNINVNSPTISSNKATNTTGGQYGVAASIGADYLPNQFSQATVSQLSGGSNAGPAVLINGNGTAGEYGVTPRHASWYSLVENSTSINIIKVTGATAASTGTTTALASQSLTAAIGDVLKLTVNFVGGAAVLTGYRNGTQVLTYTDSSSPTVGGHPGIAFYDTGMGLINFSSGSILPPGSGGACAKSWGNFFTA